MSRELQYWREWSLVEALKLISTSTEDPNTAETAELALIANAADQKFSACYLA